MTKAQKPELPSEEQDQSSAALQAFRRRATFRHGHPVEMTGTLFKEGKTFKMKKKLLCKLHDAALTLYPKEDTIPVKTLTVAKVVAGTRKYELCVMDLTHHTTSFFCETEESYIAWMQALKKASERNIESFYSLGPILGKGSYGTVRYGHALASGETVAIKVMDKSRFSPKEVRLYKRELLIMQHVSHDRIVRTFDLFETSDKLYIVLEYMARGMLYDVINTVGNFSEKKAAEVMRGVFEALVYLHEHQIIHRDLKPENILCKNKDYPLEVKIADFGLAKFIELVDAAEHTLGSAVGTPFYCAPEVARRQPYNHTCDLWSCGVIMYNLLSGRQPFSGTGKREVLNKVIEGKFEFPKEDWVLISNEAKSLIRGLLQKEPTKRLTAKAALHHPWFSCAALLDQALPREKTMLSLKENRMRRFRGAVRALIAAQWFMDLTETYDLAKDVPKARPMAFSARMDVPANILAEAQRNVQRTLSGTNLKDVVTAVKDAATSGHMSPSSNTSPRRAHGAHAGVRSSARLI